MRRLVWPYEGRYRIEAFGEYGFAARIDDGVAGLAWADVDGADAVMHMNLKADYKEYGIGTELLHTLMNHLLEIGCENIRYTISVEHWAYQIYEHLGLEIESRDMDEIHFIRRS